MSLQVIFDTVFAERVITEEMENALKSMLWSHDFSQQDMISLATMTEMLESGEIVQLAA